MSKVILVTGASTGFGALAARALARRGHIVYAGMRSTTAAAVDALHDFARTHSVDLRAIEQDVTSDSSVASSIATILRECGRLDVLVHNAGHMASGPTEAFTPAQLLQLYDVNAVGTQRVNRAALPHMRRAGRGLLVWVGSSSVHGAAEPFLAGYFAAKAGMDALAASYALELSRWGIETSIVVPGAFTSGTSHFADAGRPADEVAREYRAAGAPYEGVEEGMAEKFAELQDPDVDVGQVADKIVEVVDMPHGSRPYRVHIDSTGDGADVVSGVRDKLRKDKMKALGIEDLLSPKKA